MKTSFYFVVWIIIYPLLALFNNSFIDNNSFIIALGVVWGLSYLLNRSMPDILRYERIERTFPIMETVYTGNVNAFSKYLSRDFAVETVTAIYFLISTVVITMVTLHKNADDWIALALFAIFTWGAINRSVNMYKAKHELKENPVPEQCAEIAEETYKLDYAEFYEAHNGVSFFNMFPPRPKYYKVFQIFSMIFAIVATIFGLFYISNSIIIFFAGSSFEIGSLAGMFFLYGSLATYFGIRDIISISQSFARKIK